MRSHIPNGPLTPDEYLTLRDKKRFPIELARKLHDVLSIRHEERDRLTETKIKLARENGNLAAESSRAHEAARIRQQAMIRIGELVSQAAGASPRDEPIPVLLGRVLEILARSGVEATDALIGVQNTESDTVAMGPIPEIEYRLHGGRLRG